jgi:acetoin utilization deacetylase AcuC-like enzyme
MRWPRVYEGFTKKVIPLIQNFSPDSLVISAGFDTYKNDPIGKFTLESNDYFDIGEELSRLQLPTVIVQEGGYCTDMLGTNVDLFLSGFMAGRQVI